MSAHGRSEALIAEPVKGEGAPVSRRPAVPKAARTGARSAQVFQ
jgi:hypothetical protein